MNLSLLFSVVPQLLDAAVVTVVLTAISVVAGGLIAVPLALLRASKQPLLSWPVLFYTFAFRGTPLLVQLFLLYYGASQVSWIKESVAWTVLRDPFCCAVIAFTLNHAAYATEVFRGGINAVPVGEVEAAKAIGMSYPLRMWRIVLPRGFRIALPAYVNEVILTLKASSLASTITIMELTGTARKIVAQTFSPYEVFIVAALFYLGLTFLISRSFAVFEKGAWRPLARWQSAARDDDDAVSLGSWLKRGKASFR